MDAIILVGGKGTRLRPLTETRHKSLVPVANRPAIDYLLDWLRHSGFRRAVLALGRDNDDLAAAVPAGMRDGIEIVIIKEEERLESGGAIRNAVQAAGISGRFLVLNGDVYLDIDFADALRRHEDLRADLTLALCEVDDPSQFGVAVVDDEGLVTGFVEKPPRGTTPGGLVNAGAWIFEPGLVAEIPAGPVRVEETLFPSLVARRRRVLGYRFEGIWADIGTHARYLALNVALLREGDGSVISASASVEPATAITTSSVGDRCIVEAAATITDSILWEGVRVGAGATVEGSILADGVDVGPNARLTGAVVGSRATILPGASVRPGTLIEPGARYDAVDAD